MKISYDKLQDAIERSTIGTENVGFCLACGEEQDGCEPDARNYPCANCDALQVFGAEEILLMGAFEE